MTEDIWIVAKRLARTTAISQAAIAYVTEDHIGFKKGDTLICDASDRSIRSGLTDAKLLRDLHQRGVVVHSEQGLHSKVILLGSHAIVGSANMSGSDLTEASIITDIPQIVSGIASFIAQLSSRKNALTEKQIDSLCKIKAVRKGGWGGIRKRKQIRRLGATTWVVGVRELVRDPPADEAKYILRATAELNRRHDTENEEYAWIRWSKKGKFARECREGDTLIEVFALRNGRKRVTRRVPVLLKRREPHCYRFYLGESQRDSDVIGWLRFRRILAASRYKNHVGLRSAKLVEPETAKMIDWKWTRVH
jgi:hypothetical protein